MLATTAEPTDLAMATGPAGSEPDSFLEETGQYRRELLAHCYRMLGSVHEAEDLVQETFLRAYRAWDQFERGTRAKSWLFTICRNVFLRGRERTQRHDEIVSASADRSGPGPQAVNPVWVSTLGVDPEGDFFESIVDESILEAIGELPEEYRTAVVLSDVEGMAYAEIAELLDVPVGTVKSRLFRGRRRLQAVLYEHAVEMGYLMPRPSEDEGR
jgi:RNA polymerase sigma-70 factor (ECF subfamily)